MARPAPGHRGRLARAVLGGTALLVAALRASAPPAAAAPGVAPPAAPAAPPDLTVSGDVLSVGETLDVRVEVRNQGGQAARPLTLTGSLLGQERQVVVHQGVEPGATTAAILSFPLELPRPGVYALPLLLEHPVPGSPDGAGNPPQTGRRAYLLISLGANPAPAVRLEVQDLALDVRGRLGVRVESADGRPHRVRLELYAPRTLRGDEPVEVEVPASGGVGIGLPVARTGAGRSTRHGVLVVAEALDGEEARTSVGQGVVEIAPDPAWLPRLRLPMTVLAALLLLAAAVLEWRGRPATS